MNDLPPAPRESEKTWASPQARRTEVIAVLQHERDELLNILVAVRNGIIAYGSGPAAPIFDEFDAEVESNRGSWCSVDGAAIARVTNELKRRGM